LAWPPPCIPCRGTVTSVFSSKHGPIRQKTRRESAVRGQAPRSSGFPPWFPPEGGSISLKMLDSERGLVVWCRPWGRKGAQKNHGPWPGVWIGGSWPGITTPQPASAVACVPKARQKICGCGGKKLAHFRSGGVVGPIPRQRVSSKNARFAPSPEPRQVGACFSCTGRGLMVIRAT